MVPRFLDVLHCTKSTTLRLRISVMLMFNFVFANCARFKHFDSKMFQILHFQKRSSDFSIFTFSEKHFDCIVA